VHSQPPPVVASDPQQAAFFVGAQQLDCLVGPQQVTREVSAIGTGRAGLSGVRVIGIESSGCGERRGGGVSTDIGDRKVE
jgi:hypothetical protein